VLPWAKSLGADVPTLGVIVDRLVAFCTVSDASSGGGGSGGSDARYHLFHSDHPEAYAIASHLLKEGYPSALLSRVGRIKSGVPGVVMRDM
jgi:hypothetical protein